MLDSTVVINEIMYNPAGMDDAKMEFVELHNQLVVDMDISEWKLAGAVDYTFPDGTVLPGRSQLVVAADPDALKATGVDNVLGPWDGRLDNAGESLQLYNNDERLMNVVDYNDGGDWPEAPDGGGVSLSKSDQQAASHLAESWTFSPERGGTPGVDNFLPEATTERHEILSAGSPATAFVPSDDSLGQTWTDPDFDDTGWLQGTTGIGFDSGRGEPYNEFLGLDLDAPPNGQPPMPMEDVNPSMYARIPFELNRDASDFERLTMLTRYEDGFVAYLNGVEWISDNAPGRNGEEGDLAWNSTSEGTVADTDAVIPVGFDLLSRPELLRQGRNVLAVHVLNRRDSDNDLLFDPTIVGITETVTESTAIPLRFNEIAASGDANFFVEIANPSQTAQSLEGLVLSTINGGIDNFVFPAVTLQPGEQIAVNGSQWAFRPAVGDHVHLYSADRQTLIAARKVSDRLQGFAEDSEIWQYPSVATPGGRNSFDIESNVVINEIMYQAPKTPGFFEVPPTYTRTEIFGMDWPTWRYNQAGTDLGSDWYATDQAVDNQSWFEGQAPLGFSTQDVTPAINTELVAPRDNDPRFLTHYFQTEFELSAQTLAESDIIEMSYLLDDGALIYLNGEEIRRINLPGGEIDFETRATPAVGLATVGGPFLIPQESFLVGTNVLSVELHQDSNRSRDMVMALQISSGEEATAVVPGQLAQDNPEEWIELFNRGSEAVDLSGWKIRDAVRFDFEDGATIGSGQYLVIAKDADALRAKYPGIGIAGSFSGTLGDHDDRIRLQEATGNLADVVHYYEGGRWSSLADGGGSSLELRNPFADNSQADVWTNSDNSDQSEWVTHTRRGIADLDVSGSTAAFHEFVFGMLKESEILIDDIQVIQDPDGEAISVLQNGTFEGDTLGDAPAKWRIIGNHGGTVVADPLDAANKVLHLTATGAQGHIHDHAETTFADGIEIIAGAEYEISFRAKWLRGNSQLNSRLFYNRIPETVNLHVPSKLGSPGAANSSTSSNLGPTFSDFGQSKTTPRVGESVTISVRAADPDGVGQVQLQWREDGGPWQQSPMIADAFGVYAADIPGHDAGTIVQMYVEATDALGASATFPAQGADSRALLQVADGKGPLTPIDTFRIIMMRDDMERLYARENRMSNWLIPITLVHNRTSFYNVEVRQIGSRWIRPNSGYKIRLDPEQPFYGVHDTIRFDLDGLYEIVMKQMMNRAGGGRTSMYDDISYLAIPFHQAQTTRDTQPHHSHEFLLQLARLENIYLDEQFQNGTSGTKWELDDVVYPSGPADRDPEGLKQDTVVIETADIGVNSDIAVVQGNDPEFYRAHLVIKNQRVGDRFDLVKDFAHAIHTSGDPLFDAANEVMDVDLWMRHYANQAYFGNWDTYGFRRPKNLRMYDRPDDGKFIPFFWDCDHCNLREPLFNVTEPTSRLDEIRAFPHNLRLFWGHLLDYVNRSFNIEYASTWITHYGELTAFQSYGGDVPFAGMVDAITRRTETAMSAVTEAIPEVDFQITTQDGRILNPDEDSITLEGKGWVNVRKIRLAGSGIELDAFWPETDAWQIQLPLTPGSNQITLEAIDFQGNLLATDSVTVVSSAENPAVDSLRVSEIHYNPSAASPAEQNAGFGNDDFEFVELVNIGANAISLHGVQFTKVDIGGQQQGLDFDFGSSAVTSLEPGQRVVVVEDLAAFTMRYGDIPNVAGQWTGRLGNTSETISLIVGGTLIQQFSYDDAWHPQTDGVGAALEIVDAANPDLTQWGRAEGWRPSAVAGGTPGSRPIMAGDSNGDGVFDSSDLVAVFRAGEYEDAIDGNSTFAEGDWNGDGDFTSSDLVFVFKFGTYNANGAAADVAAAIDIVFAEDDELTF